MNQNPERSEEAVEPLKQQTITAKLGQLYALDQDGKKVCEVHARNALFDKARAIARERKAIFIQWTDYSNMKGKGRRVSQHIGFKKQFPFFGCRCSRCEHARRG